MRWRKSKNRNELFLIDGNGNYDESEHDKFWN
jgi:hypothetical protein